MMNETSNSNAARSQTQQHQPQRIHHVADCSRGQDLNQNKLKQMFANVLGSRMPTDEEDYKESPPKKILRTVANTSQQDLTSNSIGNISKNAASLPAPFPVSLSTSLAPISTSAASSSTGRTYTTLNTADQEVANAAADLMFINKGGHHNNSDSDASSIGNNNHMQQSLRESQEHTQYSPTSTSTDTSSPCQLAPAPEHALGMLKMDDLLHYITDHRTVIGRNSTTTQVHFHVANSSFVSRKHFQIDFEPECGDFFLTCGSKNGIFVDDELQRCNAPPKKLPKACAFRFPSTYLLIHFENYTYHKYNSRKRREQINFQKDFTLQTGEHKLAVPVDSDNYINEVSTTSCLSTSTDGSAVTFTKKPSAQTNRGILSTLKISIPNLEAHSDPYPSPTGTISAANSCPASPGHSFPDSQAFGNSDNRNNNHNSDDPFRPPSAVSYNETEKPPYSYAQLIIQSISSAPDKQLTLSGIYTFISKNYPYYRMEANKGWQNSIRHNLSLNRYFIKVARSQDEPGKGSFWRIDPNSEAKLVDSSFKTRRQRSVVSFKRPSLQNMPHSAPVSPSHRDNSRESSPLQDLTLQSAPGSPGMATAQEDSFDGQQGSHPQVVQSSHDGSNNDAGQVCVEFAADNQQNNRRPNALKAYSIANSSNIAQNESQDNQFKAINGPCTSFTTSSTLSNCHDVVVNYNSDLSCDQPNINQQFYFESQLKSEPIDLLEIKEEH